jgi:hypothetical protein
MTLFFPAAGEEESPVAARQVLAPDSRPKDIAANERLVTVVP